MKYYNTPEIFHIINQKNVYRKNKQNQRVKNTTTTKCRIYIHTNYRILSLISHTSKVLPIIKKEWN